MELLVCSPASSLEHVKSSSITNLLAECSNLMLQCSSWVLFAITGVTPWSGPTQDSRCRHLSPPSPPLWAGSRPIRPFRCCEPCWVLTMWNLSRRTVTCTKTGLLLPWGGIKYSVSIVDWSVLLGFIVHRIKSDERNSWRSLIIIHIWINRHPL